MATLLLTSRASKIDILVGAVDDGNCSRSNGVVIYDRNSRSSKRNFALCEIASNGAFEPTTYRIARPYQTPNNLEADMGGVLTDLKNKGYNAAESCYFLQAVGGNATVNLYAFANISEDKNGVTVSANNFGEYCVSAELADESADGAGIDITSGTVRISSVIINGEKISNPRPTPTPTPNPGDPVAVTLNNSNTGPRSAQCPNGYRNASGVFGQSGGTLNISSNTTYSCYSVSAITASSGGKGATVRDSKVSGGSAYTVNTTGSGYTKPADLKLEYVTIHNTSDGKAILGGGFTLFRSRVSGGEDAVHLNASADTLIRQSIIEEVNYPSGSHSDAIQLTSGGSGGTLTVEDSILQVGYKQQNAGLQVNVSNGNIYSSRNWYHGGAYSILGDPGNKVISRNDMFAYDTAQFGTNGGVPTDRQGAVWWSRQVRPRKSSPWATPAGEAQGFPGNGVPVSQSNPY